MKLKTTDNPCKVNGVQPEAVVAMMIADGVYRELGYELTVTSCTDFKNGRHPRSKHPMGLAFDCRIWDIKDPDRLVKRLHEALGDEYDVVLKADHIHIEFDVKD